VAAPKIPKEIREFVARFLPSVEHLETFIVLQRNATRSWSASDVAAELRISQSAAEDVLEQLASDNFLDVKISNEIVYRFNPATDARRQASARCADFYQRERIAIINFVMTARLGPMHDFAEAFRIKKGKRNA
jgi:predicted ArsR family transcriptional regulator